MRDIRKNIDEINQILKESDFSIDFFDALKVLDRDVDRMMDINGGVGYGGTVVVDLVNRKVYDDQYDAQEARDEAENPQDLIEAQFVFELDDRGRPQGEYWIVSGDFNIEEVLRSAHKQFSADLERRMQASRMRKR